VRLKGGNGDALQLRPLVVACVVLGYNYEANNTSPYKLKNIYNPADPQCTHVPSLSKIGQSAAALLRFNYFNLHAMLDWIVSGFGQIRGFLAQLTRQSIPNFNKIGQYIAKLLTIQHIIPARLSGGEIVPPIFS